MRSILTVTAAATETRLTTLDRVKMDLDITTGANDEKLTSQIDEASAAVRTYLGWNPASETLSETVRREFTDSGPIDYLLLSRAPVSSVASVTEDDILLDSDEYEVDAATGLLYRLTDTGHPRGWTFCKSVVVAYTAGYTLPGTNGYTLLKDIEAGTIALIRGFWHQSGRDPTIRMETVEGVGSFQYWIAQGGDDAFPPDAARLLAPHRRMVI